MDLIKVFIILFATAKDVLVTLPLWAMAYGLGFRLLPREAPMMIAERRTFLLFSVCFSAPAMMCIVLCMHQHMTMSWGAAVLVSELCTTQRRGMLCS